MASATLQAQFVIEKRNGETVKAQDRLTFAQDGEADEWSVGSTYDANLNLSLLQNIRREQKQETTTFEVKGLENQTVRLILNNGEEVELTLDPEGKASYLLEPEAVIERLVTADDQEIAIGRKSGGNICFRTENGQVVHRTAETGKPVPVGIVGELAIVAGNPDLMTLSYRQENDLYFGGIAWEPIGLSYDLKFTGSYDGNHFRIFDLNIDRSAVGKEYTGLFGMVSESTLENILIASGNIRGFRYTAAIAARAENATIRNCQNYATVYGAGNATAGIVSAVFGGQISNCQNYGQVSGHNEIGGLFCNLRNGKADNCTNYGTVTAEAGGAGGVFFNTIATVDSCFNYGHVEGTVSVGGICSMNSDRLTNCINEGTVSGNNGVGGIAGAVGGKGVIEACENRGTLTGKSMIFDKEERAASVVGGIAGIASEGGKIIQCTNQENSVFENFYGQIGGIVGSANKSNISYCTNRMVLNFPEASQVGSIAGRNAALIDFCRNEIDVTGKEYAGGIAGYNHDGMKIRMCENTGRVSADMFAGGICGITWGTLSACANRGDVTARQYAGGVAGAAASQYCYVLASYNTGEVTADSIAGGVCGMVRQNGLVEACYSIGKTSGKELTGGVCGSVIEGSATTACYWSNFDGAACGEDDGTGAGNTVYYFTDGTQAPEGTETGWPDAETKNWGINPEGGQGTDSLWWKNLGVNGSQTYPQLWWEAE